MTINHPALKIKKCAICCQQQAKENHLSCLLLDIVTVIFCMAKLRPCCLEQGEGGRWSCNLNDNKILIDDVIKTARRRGGCDVGHSNFQPRPTNFVVVQV